MNSASMRGLTCDIFCNVVDNYGDAGVAWRLARQLSTEFGLQIRLWLDDLITLQHMWPAIDANLTRQRVAKVEIRHWAPPFPDAKPAALVIEAFGCALPDSYLAAMARCEAKPLWLNLEYLSAEDWIKGCHGLPSPHPRLALTAYFYYPGFEPETGGLIREAGLLAQRNAYQADGKAQARFWQSLGLAAPAGDALTVSLFGYDHAGIPELLAAWAAGRDKVCCLVPEGVAVQAIASFAGTKLQVGHRVQHGSLELCGVPFVDQLAYDRLLWSCDFNFVRGEDSFIRAQWAGLPMIWNIYPQEADVHMVKLEAFLGLYCQGLSAEAASAYRACAEAWNRGQGLASAWPALLPHVAELRRHARDWAKQLASMPDLATKLMLFCKEKL